jgi:MoaA/NifB/PqqE/SkfB family radical SAM enzyme
MQFAESLALVKMLFLNPNILWLDPSINRFMFHYMRKFRITEIGGHLVLHSHLPPLNSAAFSRFVQEHLSRKIIGPSHAQVGLTNACPQNCAYCYNKNRHGVVLDSSMIKSVIQDLKNLGVVWLGLTGGEPLLNKEIVEIVESAADTCAVKLFTNGCNLTPRLALDLKNAGLFSVSVSLDHWDGAVHDHIRGCPGAFRTALKAIEVFKETGGLHVGISGVLSKDMLKEEQVEEYLQFLVGLEIHEAWLSEAKPSMEAFWKSDLVITEAERLKLIGMQDRYNKEGKITVNYLGHFEGRECFGCNAGRKMIYVDAFGEVSPCVFTPMTFGNVNERPLRDIFSEMESCFPSDDRCFINSNYELLQKHYQGHMPLHKRETLNLMAEVGFGGLSKFNSLYYKKGAPVVHKRPAA